jgi:RimJ/RimL family protein N-acetyltransferase
VTARPRLLRDGTPVVLRRLLPEDREALRLAYLDLSPESRYARFLSAVPRLTGPMLDHLVDRVDDVDHVARLLVDARDDEEIAIGRFVRDRLRPDSAEVAFTVADDRQGTGAGSALCDGLVAAARERGVLRFTAMMLAANAGAARLMQRAGEVVSREVDLGIATVTVLLRPPPDPPPPLQDGH